MPVLAVFIIAVIRGEIKAATKPPHRRLSFFLGNKYTKAMGVTVTGPEGEITPEMGCYGIGPSRLLGTIAEWLAKSPKKRAAAPAPAATPVAEAAE